MLFLHLIPLEILQHTLIWLGSLLGCFFHAVDDLVPMANLNLVSFVVVCHPVKLVCITALEVLSIFCGQKLGVNGFESIGILS